MRFFAFRRLGLLLELLLGLLLGLLLLLFFRRLVFSRGLNVLLELEPRFPRFSVLRCRAKSFTFWRFCFALVPVNHSNIYINCTKNYWMAEVARRSALALPTEWTSVLLVWAVTCTSVKVGDCCTRA